MSPDKFIPQHRYRRRSYRRLAFGSVTVGKPHLDDSFNADVRHVLSKLA